MVILIVTVILINTNTTNGNGSTNTYVHQMQSHQLHRYRNPGATVETPHIFKSKNKTINTNKKPNTNSNNNNDNEHDLVVATVTVSDPARNFRLQMKLKNKDGQRINVINGIQTLRRYVSNGKARQVWRDAGGNDILKIYLTNVQAAFPNYCLLETKCKKFLFSKQGLIPFLVKLRGMNEKEKILSVEKFNNAIEWFDCLCDIVSDYPSIWHHEFLLRGKATQMIKQMHMLFCCCLF